MQAIREKSAMEIEDRKAKQEKLLASWHPHIESAMKKLHTSFINDNKFILTESDLKCWLFYFLQQEGPCLHFAVHTEVTHYAPHTDPNHIEPEKKYRFRDLSLLCPKNIKVAAGIWAKNINDFVNHKGFKHKGPAIHFELKFVRPSRREAQISGLTSDIEKLEAYTPAPAAHIREFIIIYGSGCPQTKVNVMKEAAANKIQEMQNNAVKKQIKLFLFDQESMHVGAFKDGNFAFTTLND
jgi:hypothetical protein